MKKILSLTLIAVTLLGLVACGAPAEPNTDAAAAVTEATMPPAEGIAPHPMQRKEYIPASGANATSDELRAIAVQIMEDNLSIQWNTDHFLYYSKRVGLTGKKYTFSPGLVFAGMPYTDGASGIVQWLEFYDTETGLFSWPGTGAELDGNMGNSCASCVWAAWHAVCNSVTSGATTHNMLAVNGALPVGPYTYPTGLKAWTDYPTEQVCADNGMEIMFLSYAEILPADGLVSTLDAHAIMAKEAAHVEYLKDGSIDGENSYVIIMDQRAGKGDYFYVEMDGDTELLHSGRTSAKYSFKELFDLGYLPCCPAEFKGTDPYELPEVSFSGSTASVEDMMKGHVVANYPVAVTRLVLVAPDGEETIIGRILLRNYDVGRGKAKNVPVEEMVNVLSQQAYLDAVEAGGYKLQLVALLYNGQKYDVAEVPVG